MPTMLGVVSLISYEGEDESMRLNVFGLTAREGDLDTARWIEVHVFENNDIFLYARSGNASYATRAEINDAVTTKIEEHITADSVILADTVTGDKYKIQIQNGQLITVLMEEE